jgi:hypothetical protein
MNITNVVAWLNLKLNCTYFTIYLSSHGVGEHFTLTHPWHCWPKLSIVKWNGISCAQLYDTTVTCKVVRATRTANWKHMIFIDIRNYRFYFTSWFLVRHNISRRFIYKVDRAHIIIICNNSHRIKMLMSPARNTPPPLQVVAKIIAVHWYQ